MQQVLAAPSRERQQQQSRASHGTSDPYRPWAIISESDEIIVQFQPIKHCIRISSSEMDRDELPPVVVALQVCIMLSPAHASHDHNVAEAPCSAGCELGAVDLYDAHGCLIERIALAGDHHSLAIDLAHLVPSLLACPCKAVVLHHSHPSGHAKPSDADIAATRAIAGLLRLLGMQLHDHVIQGGQTNFSFRREGLI